MYFNYYKFRAKLNKTAILAQFGDKVKKKNANMQKKSNQEKKEIREGFIKALAY